MKLKLVVVDLELTRRQKRIGAGGLAVALALVCGVAFGDVPKTFASGEILRAADLNANFDDLDSRLTAAEAQTGALNTHGHVLRVVSGNTVGQTVTTFPGLANACSTCPAGSTVASVDCTTSNSGVTAISFTGTNATDNSGCCGWIVQQGGGNITLGAEARCLILDPVDLP